MEATPKNKEKVAFVLNPYFIDIRMLLFPAVE